MYRWGGFKFMGIKACLIVALTFFMTAACSLNVDRENYSNLNPVGISDDDSVLSMIMARFSYEEGNYSDAIKLYKKSNSYDINNSSLRLISIYLELGMRAEVVSLSNSIVYSKVKPVGDFEKYHMLIAYLNSKKSDDIKYKEINNYFYNIDKGVYKDINRRLVEIKSVYSEMVLNKINIDEEKLNLEVVGFFNYYESKVNKFNAISLFKKNMRFDSQINNLFVFRESYLAGLSADSYYVESLFLIDNVVDESLHMSIIDSVSSDIKMLNDFKMKTDVLYDGSLSYLHNIYRVSDDSLKKQKSIISYKSLYNPKYQGSDFIRNSIAYSYIKENIVDLNEAEIIDAYFKIKNDSDMSLDALTIIANSMFVDDNFNTDLLSKIEDRYGYYIALKMYRSERFDEAFHWISINDEYDDGFVDYEILRVLIINELNPELALSESMRIYTDDEDNEDFKILYSYLKILNNVDVDDSIETILNIKEYEDHNFIVKSQHTYKIINMYLSNYYYQKGDYIKSTDLIMELDSKDYITYALIGRNNYMMGYVDDAIHNFKRSREMLDSKFLKNILSDLDVEIK